VNLHDAITAARIAGFEVYAWTDLGSGNWSIRCLCNSNKVPLQAVKITRSVEVEGKACPARDRLLDALQPAQATAPVPKKQRRKVDPESGNP